MSSLGIEGTFTSI
uniref:Uncharacterized protein n=1 Tax=Anguilla anguilla TaxID=7936 RepID=A0A0E9U9S5_ANGAN